MTRVKSPQDEVNLWNREHEVGTLVRYWTGVPGLTEPKVGRTRSPAEVLSGHTAVVWVEGCRGCVGLSHVEPIAPPPAVGGSSIPPVITDAQRAYLEHALGVSLGTPKGRWGYRNRYSAAPGTANYQQCLALVEMGLMREAPRSCPGDLVTFHCTRAGCEAAGLPEDRIAEALS